MIATIQRSAMLALFVAAALAGWGFARMFGAALGTPAAILLGVFCVLALHPVFVAINFVVSRFWASPAPRDMRLSPWQAIDTYDAEVDASVRGFWFAHPFLSHRPAPDAVAPHRVLPVLFVHGYFCNRALWLPFMHDAARRGTVCEAVTLASPFCDIDDYADAIVAAIDALLARAARLGSASDQVAIVAHSMGGLAVRAAIRRHGAARIAHVITLGTPHAGTVHAHFGRSRNLRQMRPGSAWLFALDAFEKTHEAASGDATILPRARYTAVFSYHDNIVAPQESGRLAGAHNIALSGIGHVTLVYSRRVREIVFAELEAIEAEPRQVGSLPLDGGGLGRGEN